MMEHGTAVVFVMPGHVPGIHVFLIKARRGWPGQGPAMTEQVALP
jgi:hypothetical protein